MLFEVQDLRVFYDTVETLKGISLRSEEESIVAIIGCNGAGKTTTLKAISGLKRAASGSIWFEGERIDILSPVEIVKRGIAHVPEGRRLFTYMTVGENLQAGAYLRKGSEVRSYIEKNYQYFPILKKRSKQQAGSLSGGEQQMLAIARALMAKPRLLLMDEPTLGLSPMISREVAKIATDINHRDGVSVILVEQNARLALRIAQKGYVMEMGSIVLQGEAEDLLNNEHVRKAYLGA